MHCKIVKRCYTAWRSLKCLHLFSNLGGGVGDECVLWLSIAKPKKPARLALIIEILQLEQVCFHWCCKYFMGKNTL
jgi:hypothetical protein